MIITRTPLRLSLLGGGSDYPEHFLVHGGQTLGAAMCQYTFITVKHLPLLFEHRIRASYSRIELAREVDEIAHPSIRECLRLTGSTSGVEISTVSDLPARSGVGSSSSFTVGLLHALHAHRGENASKLKLAEEAVYIEQKLIQERVGIQDQYTCAHGGIVHLECRRDGKIVLNPIPISADRRQALERRLVLFYTRIQRNASEVLEEQITKTKSGELSTHLNRLSELVPEGIQVLCGDRPLAELGELLHVAWATKRKMTGLVSSELIDRHYEAARKAGAIGGKLMGAGSGGFLLFYVEPERQADVRAALGGLPEVRVRFDFTGSTIIFYDPNVSQPGQETLTPALPPSAKGAN